MEAYLGHEVLHVRYLLFQLSQFTIQLLFILVHVFQSLFDLCQGTIHLFSLSVRKLSGFSTLLRKFVQLFGNGIELRFECRLCLLERVERWWC